MQKDQMLNLFGENEVKINYQIPRVRIMSTNELIVYLQLNDTLPSLSKLFEEFLLQPRIRYHQCHYFIT